MVVFSLVECVVCLFVSLFVWVFFFFFFFCDTVFEMFTSFI